MYGGGGREQRKDTFCRFSLRCPMLLCSKASNEKYCGHISQGTMGKLATIYLGKVEHHYICLVLNVIVCSNVGHQVSIDMANGDGNESVAIVVDESPLLRLRGKPMKAVSTGVVC